MLAPAPACPSCHGTGVVTIRIGPRLTANGDCQCIGGVAWKGTPPSATETGDA